MTMPWMFSAYTGWLKAGGCSYRNSRHYSVNPSAIDGLLAGNPAQVLTQSIGVVATYVFAAALTYAILKAISIFTALRVSPAEEEAGLEPSLHGEDGYSVADLSGEGHAAAF